MARRSFGPIAKELRHRLSRLSQRGRAALARASAEVRRPGGSKQLASALLRLAGYVVLFALRLLLLGFACSAVFVLVGAVVGRSVQVSIVRTLLGLLCAIALPLAVQGQTTALLSRFARIRAPGALTFMTAFDLALFFGLALVFGRETGGAIRRHGDWFLGYKMGRGARFVRGLIHVAGMSLEHFRLPPEMQPIERKCRGAPLYGPFAEAEAPPPAPPAARWVWFHPLADPTRAMPFWETRRFGAPRGHASPDECDLGHCGTDLAAEVGQLVYASFDGVVERVERDAQAGGRAGRYLRLGHEGGAIVSRYIHLDSIRADLREGDHVVAGEPIGRAGRTGVNDSDTHLHFALSFRPNGRAEREVYVDPEPYLALWELPRPLVPNEFYSPPRDRPRHAVAARRAVER
jgi:hypothetical protein